jgi:hypothetical protein
MDLITRSDDEDQSDCLSERTTPQQHETFDNCSHPGLASRKRNDTSLIGILQANLSPFHLFQRMSFHKRQFYQFDHHHCGYNSQPARQAINQGMSQDYENFQRFPQFRHNTNTVIGSSADRVCFWVLVVLTDLHRPLMCVLQPRQT